MALKIHAINKNIDTNNNNMFDPVLKLIWVERNNIRI